jgi:hypothetical protein
LTRDQASATRDAVPKQPLKDVMTVRFLEGTFDRIDAVAGKFRRAEWIREVVEGALPKEEKRKRLPKAAKPKPD